MGREVFTDGDEWEERCSLMEMNGKESCSLMEMSGKRVVHWWR